MKAVLDAGALIAIDRRDRGIGAMLRVLQQRRIPVRTSAAVVAQVWREGARQANLARVLTGVGIAPLTAADGKRVGELLARTQTPDVVDGHIALQVDDGDTLLTSDPADLNRLLAQRGVQAHIRTI